MDIEKLKNSTSQLNGVTNLSVPNSDSSAVNAMDAMDSVKLKSDSSQQKESTSMPVAVTNSDSSSVYAMVIDKLEDTSLTLQPNIDTILPVAGASFTSASSDTNLTSSSASSVHISILPDELLLKIFSFLAMDELVSTQFVCIKWQAVTRDDELWKDFVFDTSNLSVEELTSKLQKMPSLKNIKGEVPNNAVDAILNNVASLSKMKCIFRPPLSTKQMKRVFEKYPKLECVRLDVCSRYFRKYLRIFARSEYLKEVIHLVCDDNMECLCDDNTCYMIEILRNNKNFPALEKLAYDTDVLGVNAFSAVVRDMVPTIITNRCDRLKSLKVESADGLMITEAASKCKGLKELIFCLYTNEFSVNFDKFTQLEDLHIDLRVSSGKFSAESLYASLSSSSWMSLNKFTFLIHYYESQGIPELGMLKVAIENMRELKKLIYYDLCGNTDENHLQQVGCLSRLEFLCVLGIKNITEVGMKSLSSCSNLKTLAISGNSDIQNLETCVADVISPMKELNCLDFCVKDLCKLKFKTKQEVQEFVSSKFVQSA